MFVHDSEAIEESSFEALKSHRAVQQVLASRPHEASATADGAQSGEMLPLRRCYQCMEIFFNVTTREK